MGLARKNSERSTCLRKQVGAVIVDPWTKRPISEGYNGSPANVVSCLEKGYCYRIEHNIPSGTQQETCRACHAETNAISWIGYHACHGMHLYVYGHRDLCIRCKREVVNARIEKIYCIDNFDSKVKEYNRKDLIIELNDDNKKMEI